MAEPKTKPTQASVTAFIAAVTPEQRRRDAKALLGIMQRATGEKPRLWGTSIVGYGTYVVRRPGGHEAEWPLVAFSPRKASLVLYGTTAAPRHAVLLARLGRHKVGKGCLYVADLEDVDHAVLEELVRTAFAASRRRHAAD